MGIILLPLFIGYILLSITIISYIRRNKGSVRFTAIVLILIPTYDIIGSNLLGVYYCILDQEAKTYVKNTVESPESIYWEDNVYPGFDGEDQKHMVSGYLDGVHVKRFALRSSGGGIYEYTYENVPQEYIDCLKEYKKARSELWEKRKLRDLIFENREKYPNWEQVRDEYLALDKSFHTIGTKYNKIKKSLKIVRKKIGVKELGTYRYRVESKIVPLSGFSRHFVYADVVKVIDNATDEVLAKNRRYMRRAFNILPSSGGRYYFQPSSSICGDKN